MCTNPFFRIESYVRLPRPSGSRVKYPWAKLEVGQSFLAPCENDERPALMNSLTSCRSWQQRKTKGAKRFALRIVDGGVRVWRVA
jgi:hypothetical protein